MEWWLLCENLRYGEDAALQTVGGSSGNTAHAKVLRRTKPGI